MDMKKVGRPTLPTSSHRGASHHVDGSSSGGGQKALSGIASKTSSLGLIQNHPRFSEGGNPKNELSGENFGGRTDSFEGGPRRKSTEDVPVQDEKASPQPQPQRTLPPHNDTERNSRKAPSTLLGTKASTGSSRMDRDTSAAVSSSSERARSGDSSSAPVKEKKSKKEKKQRKKRKAAEAALDAGSAKVSSSSSRSRQSPPFPDVASSSIDRSGGDAADSVASGSKKPGPKKGKKRKEARLAKERAKAEAAAAAASDREEYVSVSSSRRLPTASSRNAADSGHSHDKEPGPSTGRMKKSKKHKSQSPQDSANSAVAAGALGPFSAAQQAVNEQMRRALEEDQYSAIGSIVETDSSDDEDDGQTILLATSGSSRRGGTSGATLVRLDRNAILAAMRKRIRMESMKGVGATIIESKTGRAMVDDYGDWEEQPNGGSSKDGEHEGCRAATRGGRKKKRKKGKRGVSSKKEHVLDATEGGTAVTSDYDNDRTDESAVSNEMEAENVNTEEDVEGGDEGSIFGQTTGSINATWVECDKCKKWRRLRGVVDDKKLPSKWYCSMNKNDPERAKCTAPEEEYETPNTPESAADARTRKHLRLWVRRLQCNEAYEARLPTMTRGKKRSATTSAKEPYEWVRCCNPSCGKWRAILRCMDARSNVIDTAKNGEWYCVMNTWDEKTASCAAPQENLPAIGCPPWVMQDEE